MRLQKIPNPENEIGGKILRSLFSAPVTPPVGYASLRGSLRGKQRSIPPKVHPLCNCRHCSIIIVVVNYL